MRTILQRSKESFVSINGKKVGSIEKGLVVLVGFTHNDTKKIVDKMINKIVNLRIFEDDNGLMNLSLLDIKGSILSISQFTLYADTFSGRRPSFADAMRPDEATILYDYFNEQIRKLNIHIETGIFGADMKVNIINDGPVSMQIEM